MLRYWVQYTILLALCLGAVGTGLFLSSGILPGVIGALGLICFFILCGQSISNFWFFPGLPWRRWWAGITCVCVIVMIETGSYIFAKITPIHIFISFLVVGLAIMVITVKRPPMPTATFLPYVKQILTQRLPQDASVWVSGIVLGGYGLLFYLLHAHATIGVLPSPWLAVPPYFFLLYGATTFFLLWFVAITSRRRLAFGLILIHIALTFSVAAIVYKLGFGYDPLLHRASERHIFAKGLISPKTPFYIGQYVLVNLLAHVTHLSITMIDIWLVPGLTILLIGPTLYNALYYGFGLSERFAQLGLILLPLYPLNTLYVTTPHNLANLFTLLTALLSPLAIRRKAALPLLFALGLTAAAIHPLTGVFALLFPLGVGIVYQPPSWLTHPIARWSALMLTLLITMFVTPALFLLYFHLHGIAIDTVIRSSPDFSSFFRLFREPYYFSHGPVPWLYDLIYLYRWLIVPLLVSLAIAGARYKKNWRGMIWLTFPLCLLINIFFVSTIIRLPELDAFQQLQYAERMLHVTLFFVLPFSILGAAGMARFLLRRNAAWFALGLAACSVLLTGSWYLTYPQQNPKVYFRGFNVTQSDYEAVRTIQADAKQRPFIVIGNIVLAGAAIDTYGFTTYYATPKGNLFYYSIPTGGPLYEQYLNMVYREQKREYMESAMALTRTTRAYFAVHGYWDNAEKIAAGAKQTADAWTVIGAGKEAIWLFTYDTASSSEDIAPASYSRRRRSI